MCNEYPSYEREAISSIQYSEQCRVMQFRRHEIIIFSYIATQELCNRKDVSILQMTYVKLFLYHNDKEERLLITYFYVALLLYKTLASFCR